MVFDQDDRQPKDLEILRANWLFGKPKFIPVTGSLMEILSYDGPMPKTIAPLATAWRSIDEPEPPIEADLYDRRNGLGKHWGRAEGPPLEGRAAGILSGLKDQDKAAFILAAAALFLKVLAVEKKSA